MAAVLYGVAIRLDARPELFFDLRQVDQAELIGLATAGVVGRPRPAAGKRIGQPAVGRVRDRAGGPRPASAPAGSRRSVVT